MAAKGTSSVAAHGVKLDTLKDCLQFLEWLHDKKQDVARTRVAGRLKRLLDKNYKSVDLHRIEDALSQFLKNVSKFYKTLCDRVEYPKYTPTTTTPALNAVLECISKVLAVMYFLRYRVDAKFDKVGGGGWAQQPVGWVAQLARFDTQMIARLVSSGSEIDAYFIATVDNNTYGVIPGGFTAGELKQLSRGGYNQGSLMVGDLQNICEKHAGSGLQNYFLDVYSTSVIPKTGGTQISNVANALRLVRDFCGIFEKVRDKEDFAKHLYLRDRCIEFQALKDHCANLKVPLGNIFKPEAFSFTGYAREDKDLNIDTFSKKMASWFRKNLNAVKRELANIETFGSKKYPFFNNRTLRSGSGLRQQDKVKLTEYFTQNFFRYGFTFHGYDFTKWRNMYDVLKKDWDGVIEKLNREDDGLDKLVKILNGTMCQLRTEEVEDEEAKEELEIQDEDLSVEEDKPVATKTEAAKPVVTKAEAAKPTVSKTEATKTEAAKPTSTRAQTVENGNEQNQGLKSEEAQHQGKKAEGAQNQGKKGEGAQNQGKKTEGPDQNNGQSEEKFPSSPVAQAVQTHTSSDSSAGSELPGAHASSGGPGPVSQAGSADASQASDRAPQAGVGDSNTSRSQPAAIGGDGVGGGGSSGISNKCPGGKAPIQLWPNSDSKYCPSNVDTNKHEDVYKAWTPEPQITDKGAQYPKNSRITDSYRTTNQSIPHLLGSPRQHTAGPGTGRALYEPGEWRRRQGGRIAETDMPSLDVTGDPIVDSRDHQHDRLLAQRRKNDANRLNIQKLETQQKLAYEDKARIREIEKQKQNAYELWKQKETKGKDQKQYDKFSETLRRQNERNKKVAAELDKILKEGDPQRKKEAEWIKQREKEERRQQEGLRKYLGYLQKHRGDYAPIMGIPIPEPHDFAIDGEAVTTYNDTALKKRMDLSEMDYEKYLNSSRVQLQQRREDLKKRQKEADERYKINAQQIYKIDPKVISDVIIAIDEPNAKGLPGRMPPQVPALYSGTIGEAVEAPESQTKSSSQTPISHIEGHHVSDLSLAPLLIPPLLIGEPLALPPLSTDDFDMIAAKRDHDLRNMPHISGDAIDIPPNSVPTDNTQAVLVESDPSAFEPKGTLNPGFQNGRAVTDSQVSITLDDNIMAELTGVIGNTIKNETNKIPTIEVPDNMNAPISLPAQPIGYSIPNSNRDAPVQEPRPKFKPPDVSGSVTSGFISDVESWTKKEVMYNNIKRDLEAHKQALANDQDRRIKEAQRYGEGFKKMVHMHDDDRNQHLLDDVQESTEKLKFPSPRKLQDIVYPNEKPYVAPPVIETLPHDLQSTETTGDVSKTFIDVNDSESLPEVSLSVDILKHPPFQPLNDYDYGRTFMPLPVVAGGQLASTLDSPRLVSERSIPLFVNPHLCTNPWSVSTSTSSTDTPPTPTSPPPDTDHLPPPRTIREMLFWFVGLNQLGYIGVISEHMKSILKDINKGASQISDGLQVTGDPTELDASMVTAKLTEACLYSATVIYRMKHRDDYSAYKEFKFESVYSNLHYSPDPACLLCQLCDYVYACCHQLEFLKSQCERDKLSGGWQDCKYGSDIKTPSPLHSFLTDGWDSDFETHPFDPCNLCHKSRVRMGFGESDLPKIQQTGTTLSSILTPSCGGEGHDVLRYTKW
ncbi:Ribosome-binding protein 1 [Babesia bigemina]|uniref:Ribosome-binding protein 1 n=1 Tax=Babesia bigemina TaxID=5866 RepID=A0A061DB10_BABBI|nr:Ribosome-binding protein 1 [Babesia bigemina]CDR94910.1 Ribosome-binding protein 1 [Babesia bigemina]|eukprot:XP_012767096.1 Ribosome-binding protein 1 [Babesia bigemina]